jgi:hypothetical protein
MNTKRCPYCRKLQLADAQTCIQCRQTFGQKKPGLFRDDVTNPSLPHASPHRAGHYTGLHPEDQPYQSSKIAAQRRSPPLEVESWQYLQQEPGHIILPGTGYTPILPFSQRLVEQTLKQPPPSLPKIVWLPEQVVPLFLAFVCLFSLLVSSAIAFVLIGNQPSLASPVVHASPNILRVNDTFTLAGQGFAAHHQLTFIYDLSQPILDSNKQLLVAHTSDDGHFSVEIRVPADWEIGQHRISVIDTGQKLSSSTLITIEELSL